MASDEDRSVVVECLHLMRMLFLREHLTEDQTDKICELVFDTNKAVSHAAGQFIHAVVVEDELAKVLEELGGEDKMLADKITIKGFSRFCAEVGHDLGLTRVVNFVDALFDQVPALKVGFGPAIDLCRGYQSHFLRGLAELTEECSYFILSQKCRPW